MLLTLLHTIALLNAAAPQPAAAEAPFSEASLAAAHVPIPVPAEHKTRDKSRRVKKKLPAI